MAVDREILLAVLDALDDALIVWQPGEGTVLWANRVSRAEVMVREAGDLVAAADLAACAGEQRALRDQLAVAAPETPAQRLSRRDRAWWVWTAPLPRVLELVVCRRERLRERELAERLRAAYRLTDRQVEVLRQLLRGATNHEIARALGIAYATVRRHLSDLQGALGARDRIGVFRIAERSRP
jgi:DNA-binding CsgD family transcriptional regulator